MAGRLETPKKTTSCTQCRGRKVKCDRGTPCNRCKVYGERCTYAISKRGHRQPSRRDPVLREEHPIRIEDLAASENPIAQISAPTSNSISAGDLGASTSQGELSYIDLNSATRVAEWPWLGTVQPTRPVTVSSIASTETGATRLIRSDLTSSLSQQQNDALPHDRNVSDVNPNIGYAQSSARPDNEELVLPSHMFNWEYQGPLSWMLICSDPGVSWVTRRTGASNFGDTTRNLILEWTRRSKVDRSMLQKAAKEPKPTIAWKYCTAYFEESLDTVFGVVDRPEFETCLRAHFRDEASLRDDPAWYALRNTVYASGCRILLSKDSSMSFSDVHEEAWSYFRNAMSVHTELLFTFTGLLAVRALMAMSLFTEGLGSPSLQFMLCSNAARLAQSKGLHRQPARMHNMSDNEAIKHNWLFWAIYCFEKQIALRSARPSAIIDEEISCQIPNRGSPGSTIQVDLFTYIIQQARLASEICTRLTSVKALQQQRTLLLSTAFDLYKRLQLWKESLPEAIRPKDCLKTFQPPKEFAVLPVIMLQFSYYSSILAIYTIFLGPWTENSSPHLPITVPEHHLVTCANVVADAARNLIVVGSQLEIHGASHQWSTFSFPMMGVTSLFIYILRYPNLCTVRPDIALLDVAAGHFGRMQFLTNSDLSFGFARELAVLARKAVEKASSTSLTEPILEDAFIHLETEAVSWPDDDFWSKIDMTLDNWGIFTSGLTGDV